MTVDVHFQSGSLVRYRTYVNFGWLDLMVAFGGIAGLFLGCSILSSIEMVYYLLIMVVMFGRKLKVKAGKFLNRHQQRELNIDDTKGNKLKIRKSHGNVRVLKIQPFSGIDDKIVQNKHTRY